MTRTQTKTSTSQILRQQVKIESPNRGWLPAAPPVSILRWSEARPHPDVFLGPTVSYGEQGANRGGDLRRKGLTEETKDQKIKDSGH